MPHNGSSQGAVLPIVNGHILLGGAKCAACGGVKSVIRRHTQRGSAWLCGSCLNDLVRTAVKRAESRRINSLTASNAVSL